MPSKYRSYLIWNIKEAEELERLLGDIETDVKSINIKFKDFILKGLRGHGQIGTEQKQNPGVTELKYCIWKPNKITCPIIQTFPKLKQAIIDDNKRKELKEFCKMCPILKSNSAQGQVNISPEASREWVKQTMQRPSSSAPLRAVDLDWTYDDKSAWFLCTFCFDTSKRFFTENPDELQQHLKDVHKAYQAVSLEVWQGVVKQ